jgi:WD40 repeat protein
MRYLLHIRFCGFLSLFIILVLPGLLMGQQKRFTGTRMLREGDKSAIQTIPAENSGERESLQDFLQIQTIPAENSGERESLQDFLQGISAKSGPQYVLGGNVLWSFQDATAIANTVALNGAGDTPLSAWTLNSMRVSLYSDANNIPLWEFATAPYDPVVAISGDGSVVAATAGTNIYLFDQATGNINYQLTMPDSLYAVNVGASRDGSLVVFLAAAFGSGQTARAYAVDPRGTPPFITWTFEVPRAEITNWAGVNFSASGTKVVINGRYHVYVLNSADGSLVWDRFADNTESPVAISGDGDVIVTADLSGFIQTRVFDSGSNQYNLLWQYRVLAGVFTNWASSVAISADGNTILAGSLVFNLPNYDGSIMAFDTYGDGTPKWVYSGAGDLVDDIAVSDDGKVAAAVTWGDLAHTLPDLLVFDVATGEVTFDITTPGSFFTVDISPDGKRVFAGGKAVHAREFGNGGRIYLSEIDLGGGHVSGNVNLTNTGDNSGVLVKAAGTERSAVTGVNGDYLIENIAPGAYTIAAEKPGYNFGEITNVTVFPPSRQP